MRTAPGQAERVCKRTTAVQPKCHQDELDPPSLCPATHLQTTPREINTHYQTSQTAAQGWKRSITPAEKGINCTETAEPRPSKTKVCNTQQEARRLCLHVFVEMVEHLPDAPFLLWNPQSGEKLWHLSEADSSFLSQNSSEGKLSWPSLKAAQVVLQTQSCVIHNCV